MCYGNVKGLRILIVTPIFPPYAGGASVYFGTLTELIKNKAEIVVLTTYHPNKPIIESDKMKILRIIPNLRWPPVIRGIVARVLSFLIILAVWIVYRPKLIHTHASGDAAFSASLFSAISGVPIIKDIRDLQIFEKVGFKINLGRVEKYFSIGESVNRKLYSLGVPKDKIILVPVINTPNVDEVKRGNCTAVHKILFVGDLTKKKGVFVLLEAYKIIAEKFSDIKLTIIGDGVERRKCEKFIKENNLNNRVELLGVQPHKKVLEHMKNSYFIVLPSETEGLPRVILEAFALEKPVIATNCGEIPSVVKDEFSGILLDKLDSETLAKAMVKLLINKKLIKKFGKNGKKIVKKFPTWETLVNDVLETYRQVVFSQNFLGENQ